ncbi:MAG: P-II family nitrogen regulator [Candidatus Sumerlaeia bacterium]
MKEIVAIIRMNKMNETKEALAEAGVSSLSARKVMGRGKGKVDYLLLQGAEEGYDEAINQLGPGPKFVPKRLLNIVVTDDMKDTVIKTLIQVNQTGSPGDGKIFVRTLKNAYRVRTGESGDDAVSEAAPAATKAD